HDAYSVVRRSSVAPRRNAAVAGQDGGVEMQLGGIRRAALTRAGRHGGGRARGVGARSLWRRDRGGGRGRSRGRSARVRGTRARALVDATALLARTRRLQLAFRGAAER